MDSSIVERLNGRVLAGVFGAIVAVVGLRNENTATLAVGAAIFVVATLGDIIQRVELPGSKIVMRRADSAQMGKAIEEMRDKEPDPAVIETPGEGWWDGARYLLGERTVSSLLSPLTGPLSGCQARIFLPDNAEQTLSPAFRPRDANEEPLSWRFGQGVVGAAFLDNEFVYAAGVRLFDEAWGDTEDMQRRYKDLSAIAAAPLVDRRGQPIGVLSISSRSPATKLTSEPGRNAHLELAQQVSVCLIELLRQGA